MTEPNGEEIGQLKKRLSNEAAQHRVRANEAEKQRDAAIAERDAAIAERDAARKEAEEARAGRATPKELAELKIEAGIAKAVAAAGANEEAAEILSGLAAIDDAGTVILKNGDLSVPLDAEVVRELMPELVRARSGGGSGGRPPAAAGSGKGNEILRDIPQAEWDKMTPEQRKAVQRKRMAAFGVPVR